MKKLFLLIGIIAIFFVITANSIISYTNLQQKSQIEILPKPPPHEELNEIIQRKQPRLTKIQSDKIAKAVHKYSSEYNLPPRLIISLAFKESSLLPHSTSKAGCVGLTQINPHAHPDKTAGLSRDDLYKIDTNIKIGCMILNEYYEKDNSISNALKRYLGADNQRYVNTILASCVDEIILQKRN